MSLCVCVFFTFTDQAYANKDDISFHVFLGEAYGPSNFRLGIKSFDLGIDGYGGHFYLGGKLWRQSIYAGTGILLGGDFGFYGLLGYEWTFFKIFALNLEFFTGGTVLGKSYAIGQLGIGIVW